MDRPDCGPAAERSHRSADAGRSAPRAGRLVIVAGGVIPEPLHVPRRPAWDCAHCKEPWPCAPAEVGMAEEYVNDHLSLTMYLNLQMLDAIDDLAATGAPIPPDLFERFLGWPRALPAETHQSPDLGRDNVPRSA